jgi:hypothetical protein
MKQAEEAGSLHLGYSPCREIENQIRKAVRDGHDVQLHLHPWWIGATFERDRWQLRLEHRRISDLPNGLGSPDDPFSVVGVLSRGKQTLETMVRPVCPAYECLVYRAAEFWGQPSGDLICGLKKAGLVADSSVIKGFYATVPVPTDYRQAESAAGWWWTSAEDIGSTGLRGEHVIEFPVYSRPKPYLENFRWTKLYATLKRCSRERANMHGHGMMQARNSSTPLKEILAKLTTVQPFPLDFCKLSAKDMIRWLQVAMIEDQRLRDRDGTPVVMLGHSKDFWNDRHCATFLKYVVTQCAGKVHFTTFSSLAGMILRRDAQAEMIRPKKPAENNDLQRPMEKAP